MMLKSTQIRALLHDWLSSRAFNHVGAGLLTGPGCLLPTPVLNNGLNLGMVTDGTGTAIVGCRKASHCITSVRA